MFFFSPLPAKAEGTIVLGSVRPSVCPSFRPSVRPSVLLSVCPSVRLSARPSDRLAARPSVTLNFKFSGIFFTSFDILT